MSNLKYESACIAFKVVNDKNDLTFKFPKPQTTANKTTVKKKNYSNAMQH